MHVKPSQNFEVTSEGGVVRLCKASVLLCRVNPFMESISSPRIFYSLAILCKNAHESH